MGKFDGVRDDTRIILEDGAHIMVGESQTEVSNVINNAHERGDIAVTFTRLGGGDQGVMLSRIVRWD